jgi:inner membrane protein
VVNINGTTHYAGGLTVFALYVLQTDTILSNQDLGLGLLLAGYGALMADIDLPGSAISSMLKPISIVYNWIEGKLCRIKHRGLTHSIFAVLLLALMFWYTNYNQYLLYFSIGYISHIFLDLLTVAGVPLIYPISKFHFKLGCVKTGSGGENIVCTILYSVFCTLVYIYYT